MCLDVIVSGYAQPDHEANKQIYGKAVTPSDILEGRVPPPSAFSFRGFSQLIDDLHVLEEVGMSEPPKFQRKRSQPRRRWHAYDTARGFHRFGSNKS